MAKKRIIHQEKILYSFKPGTIKVEKGLYPELRRELMEVLGCRTAQMYYYKRDGIINIPFHIKKSVDQVFLKFGVNPEDVWTIEKMSYEKCGTDA